jgi:CRISPR-associated protein Cmr1
MPKFSVIPVCPELPAVRSSKRETEEYRISLFTPLFGGGVEAGMPDETLPIRGTSIRGHLQFWWRATQSTTTYQELFQNHSELWGKTDKASPVEAEVEICDTPSESKPCAEYAPGDDGKLRLRWKSPLGGSNHKLPYVLFPFQGQLSSDRRAIVKEPASFIEAASFILRLRYPKVFPEDLKEGLKTAVWAWVNFGGLGARTRRGCGALLCKEFAPTKVDDLLHRFRIGSVNRGRDVRDWSTLPPDVLVGNQLAPLDAIEAWKNVIDLLQMFRQSEGIARNPGGRNRPGRSRYPEPETIRRVTGRRSPSHTRLSHIPDNAFPRAEFGLPIVFHFQGEREGEPRDTVLYPKVSDGEARERMASPLILKPLALANGKAVPLIMRLVTWPLAGVELKQGDNLLKLPEGTVVRGEELSTYPDSPLHVSPAGSAIEAFLCHARKNGFHEITQ